MKSSELTLVVYKPREGCEVPFPVLEQIKEFQSERITEFFNDPYTFDIGIVTNNEGRVLGVGIIRVLSEFKMQLDPTLNDLDKALIIRDLMDEAISRRPSGEILVMVTQGGSPYVKFLEKHFDFYKVDGVPMKWEA